MFLGVGEDVDPFRPLIQGDVYRGLTIAGYAPNDHNHVAILQHPCSMRRGPELRDRVAVVPVRDYQRVRPQDWAFGHTRVVPLPTLSVGAAGADSAAQLTEPGTVRAEDFGPATRVAQLSTHGLLLFQQRVVYCATHCVVGLDTLEEFSAPALAEAELLADWCMALAERHPDIAEPEAIRLESTAFEQFIRVETDIQIRLDSVETRADARRQVRLEIDRRASGMQAPDEEVTAEHLPLDDS
jgi:hypothetical protein